MRQFFSVFTDTTRTQRLLAIASFAVAALGCGPAAAYGGLGVNAAATSGRPGPGNSLAGFSTRVTESGSNFTGQATLQYDLPNGTRVRQQVFINNGGLHVPPPPIPAGTGFDTTITIFERTPQGDGRSAPPLHWENRAWFWQKARPGFRIDPFGLPGGAEQDWFIDPVGAPPLLPVGDQVSMSDALTIESSHFRVGYELVAGDLYNLRIADDASFVRLLGADGSGVYLPLAQGLLLGTMNIAPGAVAGAFDFFALGLSGVWQHDIVLGYTEARVQSVTAFTQPTLRASAVPEPPAAALLAGGALLLLALRQVAARRG